jgi:sigma-B regulation protein RsbU (phosphoserine phosphatase)
MSAAIHKLLVPTEFPNIPGFEFSTKFVTSMVSGGDYFDIFSHQDRMRFGLLVASSSGHAMSALLLTVLLKATGAMAARQGAEPEVAMRTILEDLVKEMDISAAADLFYAVVDRRRYEMKYVRLGEVLAMTVSGEGEIKLLESSGTSVKVGSSPELVSHRLSLNPRDRLILCSRGVAEAKNLAGEPFGVERLTRFLSGSQRRGVHDIRNEILYQVSTFSQGGDVARDQTVVVVEVSDRVIKLAKNT